MKHFMDQLAVENTLCDLQEQLMQTVENK
jgi:hypothetical protein